VKDGPFKDMVIHIGPGQNLEYKENCLRRDWVPELMSRELTSAKVAEISTANNFAEFDKRVQGGIDYEALTYHGGGHVGIGGELGTIQDVYSSPGDPLFYLHHANMDRYTYPYTISNVSERYTNNEQYLLGMAKEEPPLPSL
jgi:tyrosinase